MRISISEIRTIIREEMEKLDSEAKTPRYDDEMMKAGFSKKQSKKLPDELQAGILKRRPRREGA